MTKTFCTTGLVCASIVVSKPKRSTWIRSIGSVATMEHSGAFGSLFSNTLHLAQFIMLVIICVLIFGHQNRSLRREYVLSLPWCPASRWHRSRAAWRLLAGTMNSNSSSVVLVAVSFILVDQILLTTAIGFGIEGVNDCEKIFF